MDHWIAAIAIAGLYSAAPLIFAALGGVISERSGVANIALEGQLLAAAFAAIWAGQASPALGLGAALASGAALGLFHAFLTQRGHVDHIVSGLGINLLVAGVTRYLAVRLFPEGVQVAGLPKEGFLVAATILTLVLLALLYRTPFGLRLRAVGENPAAARSAGLRPVRIRYAALTLGGLLCGLGGAFLSLADAHTFSRDMTAGKGYVAVAAVIFGRWHPLRAASGAFLFGLFYAVQTQLQVHGLQAKWAGVEWSSPVLLDTLPYLITLIALAYLRGSMRPPAALGRDEEDDSRHT